LTIGLLILCVNKSWNEENNGLREVASIEMGFI